MSDDYISEQVGRITVQKFIRSTDAAVDQWGRELAAYIEQTPDDTPFFVLVDVTGPHVGFTSHARQTSKALFTRYRDRQGYVAFLFEWRTSPYFARLFFASLGKLELKLNYFSSRSQAMAWLQQAASAD